MMMMVMFPNFQRETGRECVYLEGRNMFLRDTTVDNHTICRTIVDDYISTKVETILVLIISFGSG